MILAKVAVGGWMLLWPHAKGRNGEAPPRQRQRKIAWAISRRPGKDDDRDEEHGGANISNAVKETMLQEGARLDNSEVAVTPPPQDSLPNQTTDERPLDSIVVLSSTDDLPPIRSAALLGLAMVARGEIALIVAQLARDLLVDGMHEEPFAVVIWAILVSTLGGALGVGMFMRSWKI